MHGILIFYFPTEIPKIRSIKRKHERSKTTEVSLPELKKYAEKVNMLLMLENSDEDFNTVVLNIMESISSDWGVEDQDKEQSKHLEFFVRNIGAFFFGEICGLKVAFWDEDDNDLSSDEIKEVLQCFSAAKCVVCTGFALAFEKTCKRGDIIVSDCIDGVQTVNTEDKIEDAVKCSFYPDDTRFTPVSKTLKNIFNDDWSGILCTEQRQRKSKVVKGTIMATTSDVLETLADENMLDQLQKRNTHCGLSIGGATLLKAVKECEKEVIFVCGVGFFVSEIIHGNIRQNWFPTVAESLANYIKFRLEKTAHSHSYFSGRH